MVEGMYSWSRLNLSIQSPLVGICEGLVPGPRGYQDPGMLKSLQLISPIRGSASSDSSHHIRGHIFHLQSVGWVDGVPAEEGWMCSQRSYWLNEVMFTGTKGWLGLQYIFWQGTQFQAQQDVNYECIFFFLPKQGNLTLIQTQGSFILPPTKSKRWRHLVSLFSLKVKRKKE